MNYPTIYIATCDKNNFILKYNIYFFEKYCGKKFKLVILGFRKPNIKFKKNIKFKSLGKRQIGGVKKWSNYLIKFFKKINDNYIIFGLDDFLIVRPVDIKVFEQSINLLNPEIGRIDLQPMQYARQKKLFNFYNKKNGIKFYELRKNFLFQNTYGISAAFSIWDRSWFLKYLKKDMTPWEWEIKGSKNVRFDKKKIICSWNRYAFKKVEMLSDNVWPGYLNINGIRKKDIFNLNKLKNKNDRVLKFKRISGLKSGYQELAGKNWVRKIFGK
tara:strand:- start:15788 stop:16600 length:813 start_codon:yes stop_codon:yes gene_type:complete